ncbi:MAG: iron-sulfur cluster assembly accessory protein [Anaerolineae bacterium]|jgi:iron-sulfur cluster assembly accessory protein|nr:iron-sulfur cluster assembly accessory protein [Anaerolineae bacterium]MBT7073254.1 iron-sulfur cluster assembly accessory protein [Anaerolineae bacterium]MBT7325330.1 iron-sulfur cluster assembly accessory protein [Anaerolineae bacterium]
MLNIAEEVLSISPEAIQAVQDIMTEKKMDGHALRIYVAGSSCSGVQFGMALDDNINDTDTTIEASGLNIVVDHQSLEYARGATIEFVTDPEKGTGFVISNPNAQGGCGCGNSESKSEGESCGSGDGGCGCGH